MLFNSTPEELEEKSNMEYYAQNRVDREAAREIPRIITLVAQKKALKVMLNSNWSKVSSVLLLHHIILLIFLFVYCNATA